MVVYLRVDHLCCSIPSVTAVNENGCLVAFDFVCNAYSASQDLLQEFQTEWSLSKVSHVHYDVSACE